MPKVSIGFPVYNGARLVERALRSLLRQTFADFELIISDNASQDATGEICRRFAAEDSRIRYFRQPVNLGAGQNFLFVLEQARAECFMWAAHDDFWEPEFLAANYEVLAARPDVVLSVSLVDFADEHGNVVDTGPTGTYPLLSDPGQNLVRYLSDPGQNSRFYGLFRTDAIRQSTRNTRFFWAADWHIMARTLRFGKHFEVNRCLFRRGPDGESSRPEALIANVHKSTFFRLFPLLPFTWAVLTDRSIPRSWGIWRPLLKWNQRYLVVLAARASIPFVRLRNKIQRMCATRPGPETLTEAHEVQRVLSDPWISRLPEVHRYAAPGAVIDFQALLDITDDTDFVEAAFRQVYGREPKDSELRKWLKRRQLMSRSAVLACLRLKPCGRGHATHLPGLALATLLDQPRSGWLRLPFLDTWLDKGRRWWLSRCAKRHAARRSLQPLSLGEEPQQRVVPKPSVDSEHIPRSHVASCAREASGPRIALVTPWPPGQSGIADYARDMALGLTDQGAQVTVFTDEQRPQVPGSGVEVLPLTALCAQKSFDHIVYQVSSDADYLGAIVPLLRRYGGIVQLHDLVLQPFVAKYSLRRGNSRLYDQVLRYWYESSTEPVNCAAQQATDQANGGHSLLPAMPLCEPILYFARACIVHSHLIRCWVNSRLPALPCQVVQQAFRHAEGATERATSSPFRVGVFGDVQPNRHVDKVLGAIALAVSQGADIELDIVGRLDSRCAALRERACELGMRDRVRWHGYTTEGCFVRTLRSVDLCVALRLPAQSETSAVVARSLQLGIPTIVSDTGWFSELPSFVERCTTNPLEMQSDLSQMIWRHAVDTNYHRAACRAMVRYANEHCRFDQVSAFYLRTLEQLTGCPSRAYSPLQRTA